MKKKRWGIKLISIILIIFILLQAIQNVGKFYNKYFQNNNIKALPEDTPQPIAANFVTYKDWDAYSSLDDKYSYSTLFWIPGVSQIINIDEPAALMYPSSNKYYGYDGGSFSFRITNCAIDEDGSMCDVIVTCNNIEAWETTAGWNLAEEEIGREQYQNKRICCYVTVDNDGIMKYLDKVVPGRENPYDYATVRSNLIRITMTAHYASAVFNMTYYKAGTNRVANVNGIFGTITDIDIKHNNTAYLFDGNEGFALTKAGTIIYDKSNKYGLGGKRFLQEEPSENGIHVLHPYKDTYGVNCNNICIGQAASFIYDNTSTCSIKYVGSQCSIGYTFASPYTYRIRQPSKSVSSQLVYEEEAFEYQISSYIANNYFATRIKFVPELDNAYTSITYTDQLSPYLSVINGAAGIYVTNETGANITASYFDVSLVNNKVTVSAKASAFNDVNFYAHYYVIHIPVKINTGTGLQNVGAVSNVAHLSAKSKDNSINADFDTNTVTTALRYTVNISTGITNGTISGGLSTTKLYGENNSYTVNFAPYSGYMIESVVVDGVPQSLGGYNVLGSNSYTFNDYSIKQNITHSIQVNCVPIGYIQIVKRDSVTGVPLANAIFGVYSDANCASLVTQITTGADGTVTSTYLRTGTYYVKELAAPVHYKLNTEVKPVTLSVPGAVVPVQYTNIPLGYIEVTKRDNQTNEVLANAQFGIYRDPGCTDLVQQVVTGANGKGKTTEIEAGTYYVKEILAPAHYNYNGDVKLVTIIYAGVTVPVEIKNIPHRGYITAVKRDNFTGEIVTHSDTVFALYEWSVSSGTWVKPTHIDVSGFDGLVSDGVGYKLRQAVSGIIGTYKTGTLYYNAANGGRFKVVEYTPPYGYNKDSNWETPIQIDNDNTQVSNEVRNIPWRGYIRVVKKDDFTGETVTHDNTVFALYEWSVVAQTWVKPTHLEVTGFDGLVSDGIGYRLKQYGDTKGTYRTGILYYNVANGGKFKVVEYTPPRGYNHNPTWAKEMIITQDNQEEVGELRNIPWRGHLNATKLDLITNNVITAVDTTFALYEWSVADNDWVKPTHVVPGEYDGLVSDQKGYKLKKSGANFGTYRTGTLYWNIKNEGKFKIVEYRAPWGYTRTVWEKDILIDRDGVDIYGEVSNNEVRATINFKKLDKEINYKNSKYPENTAQADATLEGARYGLYARENILSPDDHHVLYQAGGLVEERLTDAMGKITWTNLYLGKYYIQEVTPSTGYLLDPTQYDIDISQYYTDNYYTDDKDRDTTNVVYQNNVADNLYANPEKRVISKERVIKQPLKIEKITSMIDLSDENVRVENAKFKIYLVSDLDVPYDCTYADIMNRYYNKETHQYEMPESARAMTFETDSNGQPVPELTTDRNGEVTSMGLAYGRYVIIEISNARDVQVEGEVITGLELARPFFIDVRTNSDTPLEERVITDPHMTAFIQVQKRDTRTGQIVKKAGAKYLINKITTSNKEIDGEVLTRTPVEQTLSYPNEETVGTVDNPYTTSEEGIFITPLYLDVGLYELIEIKAPEEYVLSGYEGYTENGEYKDGYLYGSQKIQKVQDVVKFKIATTAVYEEDPKLASPQYNGGNKNGNKIIVDQYNSPQMGTLTLTKIGEFLKNAEDNNGIKEFKYEERGVEGAEFSVYAAEDIYTNDNQTDEYGNRTKYYSKDQKVIDITTNAQGKAYADNLPLGRYYIKENQATYGFVLNKEIKDFTISIDNLDLEKLVEGEIQKTPVIYEATEKIENWSKQTVQTYKNERQKVEITIVKADKEHPETRLEGAVFRLYAGEDILDSKGEIVVVRDSAVGEVVTGSDGTGIFTADVPYGHYYIKEIQAPKGYATNREDIVEINPQYLGQEVEKVEVGGEIRNQIIKVEILKFDDETKESLIGTKFKVRDEDGQEVGEFEVTEDENILIKGLEINKNYYIDESQARANYVNDMIIHDETNEDEIKEKSKTTEGNIRIRIEDREGIQRVTLYNLPKVGILKIGKVGEVLSGVETDENGKKTFQYEEQYIDTAKFEIYAKEDIIHPDGKTGIIINAGTKVAEGQTENGILTITHYSEELINTIPEKVQKILNRGLPFGKYELVEVESPKGYWLDLTNNKTVTEVKEGDDDKTEVDTTEINIKNKRQSTNIGEAQPKLTIEKKADKKIYKVGDEAVYKIVVRNDGGTSIKDIEIKETVLNGKFDTIEETEIKAENKDPQTVYIERLKPGQEITLTYRCIIMENMVGKLENKVIGKGTPVVPEDPNNPDGPEKELPPVEETGKDKITVPDPNNPDEPGIMVVKKAEKSRYAPGELAKYNIEITNVGGTVLKDIKVEEDLPDGKYQEHEGVEIKDNIAVIDELKVGETITLIYEYKIPTTITPGSTIKNKVKVTGKGIVPDPDNPDGPGKEVETSDEDEETVIIEEKELNNNLGLNKKDEETGEAIQGAIFGLYSGEDIKVGDEVVLKKDELIEKATTDGNGIARFGADLPLGRYYIQEIEPAKGYVYDDKIIVVDPEDIDMTEREYKVKVDMTNKQSEIKVLKLEEIIREEDNEQKDSADEKTEKIEENENKKVVIKGAQLQILDGDTKEVLREWTTDLEPTVIKKLEVEKTYILHEKEPAPGYITSKDITFSLTKEGKLVTEEENKLEETEDTLVMKDDVTKVRIHFQDEETHKQLPGGKVQIKDKDGNVVAEFETGEESYYIEKLPVGEYTLVTTDAPEGYDSAEEVILIVEDKNGVQEATILVKRKPFDLSVEKFISKITVNGKVVSKGKKGSLQKIEVHRKKVKTTKVIIEYTIRIKNTGEVDGTIGKITDTLPEGLEFIKSENKSYWKVNGRTITTDYYKDKEIKAGKTVDLKIKVRWTNKALGILENKVTIENAGNKYGFEDINGDNDNGIAQIMITIATGTEDYVLLALGALVTLTLAVILVKKQKKINS